MTLEELDRPLVTLGGGTGRKRAEITALSGTRIFLSRIQTVLAGRKFANHLQARGREARASSQESTRALLPDEITAVDDHLATADDGGGGAFDRASLVRVVVHLHVQRLHAERRRSLGIEDDDVGIAADGNRPFPWEETEHSCRRR